MVQMMNRQMGMMAIGGPDPMMNLRTGEALEPTDDQRARIEGIAAQGAASIQSHMEAAMTAHRDAAAALSGDSPDFDAYEPPPRDHAAHMVQAHLAMAQMAAEARAVLTPEQREWLQGGIRMTQMMEMLRPPTAGQAEPVPEDPAHVH